MNYNDHRDQNLTGPSGEQSTERTDLPGPDDLTAFQRHIMAVLASAPDYGKGVRHSLESWYGSEVTLSRLYRNLRILIEYGLITKRFIDGRTNEYSLTDAGEETHYRHLDDLRLVSDGIVPERGGEA